MVQMSDQTYRQIYKDFPLGVFCEACAGTRTLVRTEWLQTGRGDEILPCEDCCQTGRTPIPFTEVWSL
jgi:hypothetical protein